jgi:hypothetical protein
MRSVVFLCGLFMCGTAWSDGFKAPTQKDPASMSGGGSYRGSGYRGSANKPSRPVAPAAAAPKPDAGFRARNADPDAECSRYWGWYQQDPKSVANKLLVEQACKVKVE